MLVRLGMFLGGQNPGNAAWDLILSVPHRRDFSAFIAGKTFGYFITSVSLLQRVLCGFFQQVELLLEF